MIDEPTAYDRVDRAQKMLRERIFGGICALQLVADGTENVDTEDRDIRPALAFFCEAMESAFHDVFEDLEAARALPKPKGDGGDNDE